MAKSFKGKATAGILNTAKQQKEASSNSIKKNIKILPELKALIPPLTQEEYAQLEENILAEGCRDALILWKKGEEYILVDGHNRHSICSKHQRDFKIEIINFKQY